MARDSLLASALTLAVALWLKKVAHYTEAYRVERARQLAQQIAEHGDVILYRSKRTGETARYFNALAEALAIGAHSPGGISFAGQHWCIDGAGIGADHRCRDVDGQLVDYVGVG